MVLTLDIRNDPAAAEYRGLAELAGVASEIRRGDPRLPAPIALHWSEDPVLALDGDRPWLYGPIERDPTAVRGRVVVPAGQRRRLADLADRPQPFQRIGFAHELDPDGPVSALVPALRLSARTCTDEVARAVITPVPSHPVVGAVLRSLDRGLGHTASVAALLDPILFGVVGVGTPEHGDLCLWYPLAVWRW